MAENQKSNKKPLFVNVLEWLAIIALVAAFTDLPWLYPDDVGNGKFILPAVLFGVRVLYAIPDIGMGLATSLTFLNEIGVNGLPAIALILLLVIGLLNFASADKLWADAFKIIGGFTTGSFAQKARVNINKKNK